MNNPTRKPEWTNKQYNMKVWDAGRHVMPTFFLEQMGNDDEYAFNKAFSYLYGWMKHKHSYNPKTQELRVYAPCTVLEHKGDKGIHYDIIDISKHLYCQMSQLEVGDVVERAEMKQWVNVSGRKTFISHDRAYQLVKLKEGDDWLNMPSINMLTRKIFAGPKMDAFNADPESVAKYSRLSKRWNWKGKS